MKPNGLYLFAANVRHATAHFALAQCAVAAATAAIMTTFAGCAAPPSSSQVMNRIQDDIHQATAPRPGVAASGPSTVSVAVAKAGLDRALLPPMEIERAKPMAATEPRFDLSVANAPAQQVFLSIATGSRYSLLVPPEVAGNISVNLKDVTVREALDALREMYGYEYRMQGAKIYIQPNTVQTRIFQINYLAGKRTGTAEMRVTSGSITSSINGNSSGSSQSSTSTPGATGAAAPSSRITTEFDGDFWTELRDTLTSIVGSDVNHKVIVNPTSGVIAVRGLPLDIRNAENYLRMTQLIVERQVMIEAKIIEVQLNDSYSSGVNWAAFKAGKATVGQASPGTGLSNTGSLGTAGSSVDPITGAVTGALLSATPGAALAASSSLGGSIFGLAFQSHDFAALLQFLETQGNVQVISSPRIATINNQKAVLKVGTDEFFVTSVSTSTTSSGTNNVTSPTINVQPFFSGIALDVTPQIDDNDAITLHLHPSVSVVAEKAKNINLGSLGSFTLPLAASTVNESDSVVRVQDGYVVAIGGLMKQQQTTADSGLPGTVGTTVGQIAGQVSRATMKSELVMLLKPTIIRGQSGWQNDLAEVQERLSGFEPSAQPSRR